jgi:hypothetical protein
MRLFVNNIFIICTLVFISCVNSTESIDNEENGDNTLIGTKWKLTQVSIAKDYQQPEIVDYAKKNIVYDFQRNNKHRFSCTFIVPNFS